MTRLLSAVFAASVTLSAAAHAADPQIIITAERNPSATRAKIVAAAATLCAAVIRHDPFGDFGTRDECIDNAVHAAHRLRPTDETQSKTLAQQSN